jgi:hypothetical protein
MKVDWYKLILEVLKVVLAVLLGGAAGSFYGKAEAERVLKTQNCPCK